MRHTFRYTVDEELVPDATVILGEADSHHLARVVRRSAGDHVELIDRGGHIWPASVVTPGPPATVRAGDAPRSAPTPLTVHLAAGLAEPGRMDLIVEKAVELGVASVTFFSSERARRVPDASAFARRLERMHRVAESAAQQAGWGARTRIDGLVAFTDVLTVTAPAEGFVLDARGDQGLFEAVRDRGSGQATVIVGPDAGLSAAEFHTARTAGFACCRMGEATLRAETAALTACVIAATAMGRLGGA